MEKFNFGMCVPNSNKTWIWLGILLLLSACGEPQPSPFGENIYEFRELTILDSVDEGNKLLRCRPDRASTQIPVYYIGPAKDTVKLKFPLSAQDWSGERKWKRADSLGYDLQVTVDTSMKMGHLVYCYRSYWRDEPLPESFGLPDSLALPDSLRILDSILHYKAYGVIVENRSNVPLLFGIFNKLGKTIVEAKDSAGSWQSISQIPSYFCGTSARTLLVEPGELLIGKYLRQEGDFLTDLRLKTSYPAGFAYSNVFRDYINPEAFHLKEKPDWIRELDPPPPLEPPPLLDSM